MSDDEKSKLYRAIVQRTDDHFLMERMRLYGFWPDTQGLPEDPPEEAAQRTILNLEAAQLRQQHSTLQDPDQALAEERKRRWEESKKRRSEKKEQRKEEAKQRREEYESYRKTTTVHVGEGFSAGLQNDQSNVTHLSVGSLPVIHRSEELAEQMGIALSALRWLTYHRRGATVVHYHRYDIAKKTGGVRSISAPKPALASAQQWILANILERIEVTDQAHGFVRGRSIVSNAVPHTQHNVVINLDVKDFFPTITFRRVKGLFCQLGYSEHLATTLALLCTEPPRVPTEFNGKVYHVALGQRVLPQGACTSPAITNAICRKLDRRLAGLARKHGYTYTRYADDLTLSGQQESAIGKLLKSAMSIVTDEGFTVHPDKTQVMRRSARQEVTGVIVNQRPTISRKEVRQLRAILHKAKFTGLQAQNRDDRPNFIHYLRGRIAFIAMVDPSRGQPLKQALNDLLRSR